MGYEPMGNEPVDWMDPESILLAREGAEEECDVLHSMWTAGTARAKTFEVEKTSGDMLGASPYESSAQDHLH